MRPTHPTDQPGGNSLPDGIHRVHRAVDNLPVRAAYEHVQGSKRWREETPFAMLLQGLMVFLTDVVILPMRHLWRLKVPRWQRLPLMTLLRLGRDFNLTYLYVCGRCLLENILGAGACVPSLVRSTTLMYTRSIGRIRC